MQIPEHALVFLINIIVILPAFLLLLKINSKRNLYSVDALREELKPVHRDLLILTNFVNNNIKSALISILYEELSDLSNETRIELSLWAYFRNKASEMAQAYYELRNMGVEMLKEQGFSSHLIGSGTVELIFLNPDFPLEFTNRIDTLNRKNYKEFKDSLFLELTLNTTDDKTVIIKTVTKELFRKNVRNAYKAYKETKHLIKHKENSDKTESSADKYIPQIELDKIFIKDLISSGKNGIERALNIIKELLNESEKVNEFSIHSSRFFDYTNSERLNTGVDKTELNKIRQSLLEFIDTL